LDFDRLANQKTSQGIGRTHMVLAMDFRRQAQVCARLAEDCEDRRLAERFKKMAIDLLAKADDFEELPSERVRHEEQDWSIRV
jgi:hypothetical protein